MKTGKPKDQQNIDDVEFILQEIRRFGIMNHAETRQYLQNNPYAALTFIDIPSKGSYLCGKDAYNRFYQLARRTLKRGSIEGKNFDVNVYVRALRMAFVEKFIENDCEISQSTIAKMIHQAQKIASDEQIHVTYHIPCVVFSEDNPASFTIGPVEFKRTEKFLTDNNDGIVKFQAKVKADNADFADKYLDNIQNYYSSYEWVASVKIPACHTEHSRSRAERTIDAALDVIRLSASYHLGKVRRANAESVPLKSYVFATDQDGYMLDFARYESKNVRAGEGWHEAIMQDESRFWHLFGAAIDSLRFNENNDELNQRLIDALNWFGQAVVEQQPAAKIVKYTAALERLTMTAHIATGIEALVKKRAVFLNGSRTDKNTDEIIEDIGKIYQCRSDLMHGSESPYAASISDKLHIAWEVSKWAIIDAAQLFASLRSSGKTSRNNLCEAYERMTFSPSRICRPCPHDRQRRFPVI